MEEFTKFQELFYNGKTTAKQRKELHSSAIEWYEKQFGACFGSHDKNEFWWAFKGGLLSFSTPLGEYIYSFIIQMAHYEHWKLKEWKEGFEYGTKVRVNKVRRSKKPYFRDANPYSKVNFYANSAWDAGYIMALSNFSFKKRKNARRN